MNRRRSPTAATVASVLLPVLLAACGGSKIQAGNRPALLLDQVNSIGADVNVGDTFTYAVVLLRSVSDQPVKITKVTFTEPKGIGTIVKPLAVDVYHMAPKDDWPVRNWRSFPPTAKVAGKCRAMTLEPAEGAVIQPGAAARLVVQFDALKEGDYFLDGQKVDYTVDGKPGSITLPNRFLGTVSNSGGTLTPTKIEQDCAQLGNLPSG